MPHDTYDVLANSCYGTFAFPSEFVLTVFTQFPPTSEIGANLFPFVKETLHILTPADEPDASWNRYYVIQGIRPLSGAYQCILADLYIRNGPGFKRFAEAYPFFATADMISYHTLNNFAAYEWRTNVDIIKLAYEANIIGKEFGSSLLRIEKIPIHCGFHIINDAGKEEVVCDFPV